MSIEAVLTVVTVVLAVIALIPRERAQDLKVRLGSSTVVPVVGIASLVIYWTLLEEVHSTIVLDRLPRPFEWPGRWGPSSLSLVILLGAAVWAYRNYRRPLPTSRLPRLAVAVADALARRKYGECVHLLETHMPTIVRAHAGKYWQAQLRRRLAPTPGELFLRAHQEAANRLSFEQAAPEEAANLEIAEVETDDILVKLRNPPRRRPRLDRFAAWAEAPRDAAHDLVRQFCLTPALAREIAQADPYLGLRIFELDSTWIYREFATDYARELIEDPQSVIYRELRRSENIDSYNVPILDQREQPLLWTLAEDAFRAGGPRLLYTFLDAGIESVRSERRSNLHELLSGPLDDFAERGRWSAPPFATIYLVEIVGPRVALHAGAPTLNLYLLRTLVSQLLHRFEPTADVDVTREWPTPTHYLMYAVVSCLRDLIRILKERPEAIGTGKGKGELSLPHHAIQVLGAVMYEILRSDKFDSRFKGSMLDAWWHIYSDKHHGDWAESQRILGALARGGDFGGDMKHREGLADALKHIDVLVQLSPAAEALRRQFKLTGGH